MLMIGTIDLTNRDNYQFTQADDSSGWEDADNPRRNVDDGDTLIVSRSNKVSDVLNFFIICHGASEFDGEGARANYEALRAECEAARLFSTTRGRQGAPTLVQKAIPGQTTPDVWTIKRYHIDRVQHSLGSLGLIPCRLMLVCVEGIAGLNPSPAPARFFIEAITPTVVVGSVSPSSSPAVFTLDAPVPDVEIDGSMSVTGPAAEIILLGIAPTITTEVSVTPSPAVFTIGAPVPEVAGPVEIIPDPAVFTIGAPEPGVLQEDAEEEVIRSSYATRPAAGTLGRYWVATDSILSAYDDGTNWQEYYGSMPLVNDGFPSTWVNQGSATSDVTKGGVYLHQVALGGDNVRLLVKTAPATPYVITVAFLPQAQLNGHGIGIVFRDSVSGKLHTLFWGNTGIGTTRWNSPTSWNSNPVSGLTQGQQMPLGLIWMRMSDDGTNRKFFYSTNGQNFFQIESVARATFATPDQVGIALNNNSAADSDAWYVSWDEA